MTKPPHDSPGTPRALVLTPEAPFPAVGGGALRTASLVTYLRRHFALDVVAFRQPGEPDPAEALAEISPSRLLTLDLRPHSKRAWARGPRNMGRLIRGRPPLLDRFSGFDGEIERFISGRHYELALIEHFWCAPYLTTIRPYCREAWLDLHNIESIWHRRLAETESGLRAAGNRRFAALYRGLEEQWLPRFDRLLATSCLDAQAIVKAAGRSNIIVYPNAIPEASGMARCEEDVVAFTGNLEFQPNVTAVRFFLTRIWPKLLGRFPGLRWQVIGKNPRAVEPMLRGAPQVELMGPVPDAIAALAKAKVAVAPVLSGSGTRIKILEAWAAATPVVSTSLGAEGLEANAGEHLLIADGAEEFVDGVTALLESVSLRRTVGQAGLELCRDRYTWARAWAALDAAISKQTKT